MFPYLEDFLDRSSEPKPNARTNTLMEFYEYGRYAHKKCLLSLFRTLTMHHGLELMLNHIIAYRFCQVCHGNSTGERTN